METGRTEKADSAYIEVINNAKDIELEKMENSINNNKETVLAAIVCDYLQKKDSAKASEILVNLCKKKFNFYTTKVDDVNEIWVYDGGIYIPNGRSFIKEYCRKVTTVYYTELFAHKVISKIEADTFIDQDKFFNQNNKNEIAVLNGILNLNTRQLEVFTPNKIFFSKVNARYMPGVECPKIDTFFSEILPDKHDVDTIYEMFGFCLYKDYFLEKAIMLLGDGRNGKGKTLTILKTFLSDNNITGIPLQKLESGDFKESGLLNKLANVAGDISNYPLKETNKFKGLTGRDLISASRKFKIDVSFVNYAKLIFATNHLPKTYDLTTGFFDRWVFINFPYTFKAKPEYEELMRTLPEEQKKYIKLMDEHRIDGILDESEMSGLLNKALEGLDRLNNNHSFTSSKSGEATKQFWIRNSDSFLAFALEYIEADPESAIEKEHLRKAYQKFCKKNKVLSEGDRHIKEILVRQYTAGEERKGSSPSEQKWYWAGIRLKGPIKTIGSDNQ